MIANLVTPLCLYLRTAGKRGVEDFRIFGALTSMMCMFLTISLALRDRACYVAQTYCKTLNKIFRVQQQACFQMFQTMHRIVDTVFEYVYKWLSCLAPKMFYYNENMAGGKILKGLQNRRIDERAVFLS